jgi:hypothetical protein
VVEGSSFRDGLFARLDEGARVVAYWSGSKSVDRIGVAALGLRGVQHDGLELRLLRRLGVLGVIVACLVGVRSARASGCHAADRPVVGHFPTLAAAGVLALEPVPVVESSGRVSVAPRPCSGEVPGQMLSSDVVPMAALLVTAYAEPRLVVRRFLVVDGTGFEQATIEPRLRPPRRGSHG